MKSTIITDLAAVATNAVSVVEGLQAITVPWYGEYIARMNFVKELRVLASDTKKMSWETETSDVTYVAKTVKKTS